MSNRDYEDESLFYILTDLEKKYPIQLKYNATLLPVKRGSYSFENIRLTDVMTVLFKETDLSFLHTGSNIIVILPKTMINVVEEEKIEVDTLNESDDDYIETTGSSVFNIIGSLIDSNSLEPIKNALILIESTGEFAQSDQLGQFRIPLAGGNQQLTITSLTHYKIKKDINVLADDFLEIKLSRKAYLIEEIVIESKAVKFNIKDINTGLTQLSSREIKQLSSFMGEKDVLKSILTLAGVNNIGEGSSGFNVRGGSIDQNLILHDVALVYNPSHILGFFSTFNPDIVREVLLYKGHIPANYGGRTTSVLDVKIKEADYEDIHASLSTGLISSSLALELPIINKKTSVLLAGRSSYSDWVLDRLDNPDIRSSGARFYDMNVKLSHKLSDKSRILASYFRSFDRFNFSTLFGYDWTNSIIDLQWKHIIKENISTSIQISKGQINNTQFQPSGAQAFELSSGMSYWKSSMSLLFNSENHIIKTGVDWIRNSSDPEILVPIASSGLENQSVNKDSGEEYAVYVDDEIELSDKIGLSIGLRYALYRQLGPYELFQYNTSLPGPDSEIIGSTVFGNNAKVQSHGSLEPRVSFRYSLNETSSLKLSYNRISQFIHLISNTATPTPIDIWQVSTPYIDPLRSNSYSIGYFKNLNENNIELSVESYYRSMDNTVDYRDFAQLLLNPQIETSLLKGIGKAYGAELSIQKSEGKMSGRISYAYSRSLRRVISDPGQSNINNGDWFSANYDQPHTIKMLLNWKTDKRATISFNFIYSSGRPITAPISNYNIQGVTIPHFSDRNKLRIPDYHRLDFSYTFRLSRRSNVKYKSFFTFSIYNLYARKNAFSIFYKQNLNSIVNASKLSIVGAAFPGFNLSIEF